MLSAAFFFFVNFTECVCCAEDTEWKSEDKERRH